MTSEILAALYRGDRPGAHAAAQRTPLLDIFEAAALGALEDLIERCEEDRSAVSAVAADGWMPLHLAAFFGNAACVKELVRRGAVLDAHSQNATDATPLHSAVSGGSVLAAAALIAAGADINAVQAGGVRPLDAARATRNADLIALLEAAGAAPGAPPLA